MGAVYNYEKSYNRLTIGGQISFTANNKPGSIDILTIQKIVCSYIDQAGVCQFRQIDHGKVRNPSKVIIDKNQYDALMLITNPV